jgi:hypothetical protein
MGGQHDFGETDPGSVSGGGGAGYVAYELLRIRSGRQSFERPAELGSLHGSYQIFVKENGKCELRANVGGKAPAVANVFSYAEPAKYEFEVVAGNLKVK